MLGLDKPDHIVLREIGTSTAAWSAVFVLINTVLLRRRSLAFNNRVVSLLHALVALLVCPVALNWHHPLSGFGQKTTDYQVLTTKVVTYVPELALQEAVSYLMACYAALCHESQPWLFHI